MIHVSAAILEGATYDGGASGANDITTPPLPRRAAPITQHTTGRLGATQPRVYGRLPTARLTTRSVVPDVTTGDSIAWVDALIAGGGVGTMVNRRCRKGPDRGSMP